ncbi:hypothetical protein R1flu_001135 [Riccia fluitans]|uniref:Uncharacterized protein n=1 Tax=Riccia fluitans TaxID=41844 RepID=A0ABD1Y2V0_9MARC
MLSKLVNGACDRQVEWSSCDLRAHLEHLNRKLQKMEEDISLVQQQLERGMIVPQSVVWGLVGMGVATSVLLGVGHMYLKAQV